MKLKCFNLNILNKAKQKKKTLQRKIEYLICEALLEQLRTNFNAISTERTNEIKWIFA